MPILEYTHDRSSNIGTKTIELDNFTDGTAEETTGTRFLYGPGIDPTGATDSTAGLNSFFAGLPLRALVEIPAGAVFLCSDTVTIPSSRLNLIGNGEFAFTNAVGQKSALAFTGDDVLARDFRVTIAPGNFSKTLQKNYGVIFNGAKALAFNVTVDGAQNGIVGFTTSSRVRVIDCVVNDIQGAGDGINNSGTNGEDRGDGIVLWGGGQVRGCEVSAAVGTDARCGIHIEDLDPPYTTQHSKVIGNRVEGKFRRSIATERVDHAVVNGNTVEGFTWWGIIQIYGTGGVISGNTVYITRTAADNQGSIHSPARAGILTLGQSTGLSIVGNTIDVASGSTIDAYIRVRDLGGGSNPNDVLVSANNCGGAGTVGDGIIMENAPRPVVIGNTIAKFTTLGINTYQCADYKIDDNTIIGPNSGTSSKGFATSTSGYGGGFSGNRIRGCYTGAELVNQTLGVVCNNNDVEGANIGIEFFGTTGTAGISVITGNRMKTVTTKMANIPAGAVVANNTP